MYDITSFSPPFGVPGNRLTLFSASHPPIPARSLIPMEATFERVGGGGRGDFTTNFNVDDEEEYSKFSLTVPLDAEEGVKYMIMLKFKCTPAAGGGLINFLTQQSILISYGRLIITSIVPSRVSVNTAYSQRYILTGTELDELEGGHVYLTPGNRPMRILPGTSSGRMTVYLQMGGSPLMPGTYRIAALLDNGMPVPSNAMLTIAS